MGMDQYPANAEGIMIGFGIDKKVASRLNSIVRQITPCCT